MRVPFDGDFGQSRGFFPGHDGIDYLTPPGTPVLATAAGVVTYVADEAGGYGNVVRVLHDDGHGSLYAHLRWIMVHVAQRVAEGEVLGESGGFAGAPGSGNSDGPHLHFGINTDGHNAWVDPAPLLSTDNSDEPDGAEPAPDPGPNSWPGIYYQLGAHGRIVGALREQVYLQGSDPGANDGGDHDAFGPNLDRAIREFQADHHDADGTPLVVDGIVGPLTWGALFA